MKETRFKQTEIGLVPEDWKVSMLGNYCKVNGRIGFRGYTTADLVPPGKGALTIGGKHITHNRLDLSEPDYISWGKYYESPEIMVKPDDIVLAQRGTLGKSALIPSGIGAATINPSLVLLNAIKCNPKYLIYFLQSKITLDYIQSINGQTSIPMISQTQIEGIDLLIPPISEQEKIAEALGDMDALIAGLDKLIAKKRLIKQGTMQQLLTGRTRLKEFNEPWKMVKLNELGVFRGGGTPSTADPTNWNGDTPWISSSDLFEDDIRRVSISRHISRKAIETSAVTICPKGSILIVTRVGVGKVAIAPIDLCTSQDFASLLLTSPENEVFLAYKIGWHLHTEKKAAQGSIIKGITTETLRNFKIKIPTRSEQQAIASILTDMYTEISELEKKKAKYEKIKQGMMQQLLTGKIRLI